MKAYYCHNEIDFCAAVVFAESAGKARYYAMTHDCLGDGLEFMDITVRRAPSLDQFCNGRREMDWFDSEDRIALVKYGGFTCDEDYFDPEECKRCAASEDCDRYNDWIEEMKDDDTD